MTQPTRLLWPRLYTWALTGLWVALLLTLPLESSPLLPRILGGQAVVRPLALFPMIGLFALEALPLVWRMPWPRAFPALLAFWGVALAASVQGWFLLPMPEQGFTPTTRLMRGWMTLAVGSAFYLVTWIHMARHPRWHRRTLCLLYLALFLVLVWASLQVVYIVRRDEHLWAVLNAIQLRWISTRPLPFTRVAGATYEPSWLALQFTVLFYPWLWAGMLSGFSLFPRRGRWLTVEAALWLWMVGILLFTFSRSGLAVFMALTGGSLVLWLGIRGTGSLVRRVARLALVATGLILFAGVSLWAIFRWNAYVASHFERLMKRLGRTNEPAATLVLRTLAGSRWGEWQYGYAVYQDYPVLGVGLGLLPFYLDTHVPSGELSAWFLHSVMPGDKGEPMMHTRNLYIRLLAETGIVGLAVFLAFQLAVLGEALSLTTHPDPFYRWLGWSGVLALIAVFLFAIAFDSFSLPHHWVVYGILSGAAVSAKTQG